MGPLRYLTFPTFFLQWLSCFLLIVPLFVAAQTAPSTSNSARLQSAAKLIDQGDLAQAESEARKLLPDTSARPLAYALLGSIRLRQKNYTESAQFFRKALQLNPKLIGSYISLGNVYALESKPAQAATNFREALRLAPGTVNARFALAQIESQSGRYAASLRWAAPILPELHRTDYGLVLLASDNLGQASGDTEIPGLIKDWAALPAPNSAASLAFAQLFASHNRVSEAASILEELQNKDGGFFDLFVALGNYDLHLDLLQKAATEFRLALDARNNCSSCLFELARISERQSNLDEALGYALRAKEAAPNDPDILFETGRLCLQKDLYDDAIANLEAAHHLRPDNASFQYVLASAYTGKKEYKSAIALLEHLLAQAPKDATLAYSLGAVQYLNSDLSAAETQLRSSIYLDSRQIAAYYYLGLTENGEGKPEEAAHTLQSILEHHPDHAPTLLALGEILSAERRYSEARTLLERATQLDASSVKGHYQLGMVLARLGQTEASQREFAIVKSLNKQSDDQGELQIFSAR